MYSLRIHYSSFGMPGTYEIFHCISLSVNRLLTLTSASRSLAFCTIRHICNDNRFPLSYYFHSSYLIFTPIFVHSVVKMEGNPDLPAFRIEAILDPVSSAAQKMAPILMVLQKLYNLNVKIYMNCKEKLSEMPLKRFSLIKFAYFI